RPHQSNRHWPAGFGRRDHRDGRQHRVGAHAHQPVAGRGEHAVLARRTCERHYHRGWKCEVRELKTIAEIARQTPVTEDVVRKLKLEDTVYIDGHIYGIRDATQIRIFDEGVPPPTDLTGAVCLHTAPGVRKLPDGKYEKICIGTTTSTRMNRFYPGLIKQYGV